MSDCNTCFYNNAGISDNTPGPLCSNPDVPKTRGIPDCPHYKKRYLYRLHDLEAENAKLRELVRILYYCGLPWKDCDKCAMNGAEMHVEISDVEFCDGMYDRMRELGVDA